MNKNIHDGVVIAFVECTDPKDSEYCTGTHIDKKLLSNYELNVGDKVQYQITKNHRVKIISKKSKVYTTI